MFLIIAVKFIFNRFGSLNRNGVEKVVSLDKEDEDLGKNTLPSEALPSGLGTLDGKKDVKEEEPSLNTRTNGHTCGDHLLVKVKSPCDKTSPMFEVDPKHMSKPESGSDKIVKLKAIGKPLVQSTDLTRPLKKRKLDVPEMLRDMRKDDEGKSTNEFGVMREASIQGGSASEGQLKCKYLNGSPREERGLILKPEQKLMELSSGKLHDASPQKDDKNDHKALQAPLPVDVVSSQLDICRLSIYCLFMLQQICVCGLFCQGVLLSHLRNLHPVLRVPPNSRNSLERLWSG